MDEFAGAAHLPTGQKLPIRFFEERVQPKGSCIKAYASETKTALTLALAFGELVLVPKKIMLSHVDCLRKLAVIVSICSMDDTVVDWTDTLMVVTESHHMLFLELYGQKPVRPKFHLGYHIVHNIKKHKRNMNCFGPERRHSLAKQVALHAPLRQADDLDVQSMLLLKRDLLNVFNNFTAPNTFLENIARHKMAEISSPSEHPDICVPELLRLCPDIGPTLFFTCRISTARGDIAVRGMVACKVEGNNFVVGRVQSIIVGESWNTGKTIVFLRIATYRREDPLCWKPTGHVAFFMPDSLISLVPYLHVSGGIFPLLPQHLLHP